MVLCGEEGSICEVFVGGTIAIRSLVNASSLQFECARVFRKVLPVPVLLYGGETMVWRKETSNIRPVQMDNLKGMLGIRRINRVSNARIRELCEVKCCSVVRPY